MLAHVSVPTVITSVRTDAKKIAGDVVVVGGVVTAVLAAVVLVAPLVHIPVATVAIIASISAAVTGVVNQARRVASARAKAKQLSSIPLVTDSHPDEEWWIEPIDEEEHHNRHHRTPKYFDVKVRTTTRFRTKDVNDMSVSLIDGQSTTATVGSTVDANGQVTTDPVAPSTVTWTVDSPLVTIAPASDGLSVVVTAAAGVATGTVTLSGSGTTVGGVPVTGKAVIPIVAPAVGAPVSFEINFSTPA